MVHLAFPARPEAWRTKARRSSSNNHRRSRGGGGNPGRGGPVDLVMKYSQNDIFELSSLLSRERVQP